MLLLSFDLPYSGADALVRAPSTASSASRCCLPASAASEASARLEIELAEQTIPPTPCIDAELERLRAHNPTGRALPLLAALAAGIDTHVSLDYVAQRSLRVRVSPLPRATT